MKSMTTYILFFASLSIINTSEAMAENQIQHTVYAEAGGPGILYSFNYDFRFNKVAFRLGASYLGVEDGIDIFAIPATIVYLVGEGSHFLELGGGAGYLRAIPFDYLDLVPSRPLVYGIGIAGYRYQHPNGGLFFRAGISPLINDEAIAPLVYISVGFSGN